MSFPLRDLYLFDEFELSRSRRTLLRKLFHGLARFGRRPPAA